MMERVALSAGRCGSECVEYSNVAEEARQYIAAILTGVVIRHFVEAIAFERGHSLDVRRYMWQMEY